MWHSVPPCRPEPVVASEAPRFGSSPVTSRWGGPLRMMPCSENRFESGRTWHTIFLHLWIITHQESMRIPFSNGVSLLILHQSSSTSKKRKTMRPTWTSMFHTLPYELLLGFEGFAPKFHCWVHWLPHVPWLWNNFAAAAHHFWPTGLPLGFACSTLRIGSKNGEALPIAALCCSHCAVLRGGGSRFFSFLGGGICHQFVDLSVLQHAELHVALRGLVHLGAGKEMLGACRSRLHFALSPTWCWTMSPNGSQIDPKRPVCPSMSPSNLVNQNLRKPGGNTSLQNPFGQICSTGTYLLNVQCLQGFHFQRSNSRSPKHPPTPQPTSLNPFQKTRWCFPQKKSVSCQWGSS